MEQKPRRRPKVAKKKSEESNTSPAEEPAAPAAQDQPELIPDTERARGEEVSETRANPEPREPEKPQDPIDLGEEKTEVVEPSEFGLAREKELAESTPEAIAERQRKENSQGERVGPVGGPKEPEPKEKKKQD